MSKIKNRTKTEALTVLVQSRDDAALQIKRIGDLQRNIERIQADQRNQQGRAGWNNRFIVQIAL